MTYRLICADVLDGLRSLPDESVQCVVTSPPYWGLRDYGVAGQLGLERTPDEYVAKMVGVFREVRRALRNDGTLWLNIGDSYAGSWGNQGRKEQRGGQREVNGPMLQRVAPPHVLGCDIHEDCSSCGRSSYSCGDLRGHGFRCCEVCSHCRCAAIYPDRQTRTGAIPDGAPYKAKDLIGIPWMLAFALQADGWYLRSDIIWSKPNPMPESVTDRPTKAHEYLFLLTKSARYYYDADAIREPAAYLQPNSPESIKSPYGQGFTRRADPGPGISGWAHGKGPHSSADHNKQGRPKGNARTFRGGVYTNNKSFDNSGEQERDSHGNEPNESLTRNRRTVWTIATEPFPEAHFATFPTALVEPCILAGSRVGDTILDPFNGSGTTGVVALSHQRNYIGIELNPAYVEMARRRLSGVAPMFATEATA